MPALLMATALSATVFSCDDDEKYHYTAIEITGDWKETGDAGHTLYSLNTNGTASETSYTTDVDGNVVWNNTAFSQYIYTDGDGMILLRNKTANADSGDKSYYVNDTLYVKHVTTDPFLTVVGRDNVSHNWSRTTEKLDGKQIIAGTWKQNTWDGAAFRTFAADGTGKEVRYAGGQREEKTFNYEAVGTDGKLVLNYGGETTSISLAWANGTQIFADETTPAGGENAYLWFKVENDQPAFTNSIAGTWKETTSGGDTYIRSFGPNGKFREYIFMGNDQISSKVCDYSHANDNLLTTIEMFGDFAIPTDYTITALESNAAKVADVSGFEMDWVKVSHGYEKLIGKWSYEYKVGEDGDDLVKTLEFNMDGTGTYTDETGVETAFTFTFLNGEIAITYAGGETLKWTPNTLTGSKLDVADAEGNTNTYKKVVEE